MERSPLNKNENEFFHKQKSCLYHLEMLKKLE